MGCASSRASRRRLLYRSSTVADSPPGETTATVCSTAAHSKLTSASPPRPTSALNQIPQLVPATLRQVALSLSHNLTRSPNPNPPHKRHLLAFCCLKELPARARDPPPPNPNPALYSLSPCPARSHPICPLALPCAKLSPVPPPSVAHAGEFQIHISIRIHRPPRPSPPPPLAHFSPAATRC